MVILKWSTLLANGRELLKCVLWEAEWNNKLVVERGSQWRHIRDYVASTIGFECLFEEELRRISLGRIIK